jgi:site-specific recombinase XerD
MTSATPSARLSVPGCSAPPSPHTRRAYERDLHQFLAATGINPDAWEQIAAIRPDHVSRWRDRLAADGMTNSSIRRKLTALRSLFSYLKTYGYSGANPAHGKFVKAPAVPRDGKTVGLSPHDCRRLLDAPRASQTGRRRSIAATGRCSPCSPIPVAASASWSGSVCGISKPAASTAS